MRNKKQYKKFMKGRIEAHPDGYAFFVPDLIADKKDRDLFVPASKLNSAVNGDLVTVKKTNYKGRTEGHVVEILERGLTQVVGRVEIKRNYYIVIPFHRKFVHPIFVSKKNGEYAEDDVVVCELQRYPDAHHDAGGKIVQRLGHLGDKGIENLIVMSKYELTREFSSDLLNEAEQAAKILPTAKEQNRKDFRDLFTVTIDGEHARDFDDAISVEKTGKNYVLYVHIADVSHYVAMGGGLDREANRRGTSVYFPEFAIPMLPESLSNGSCSLKPNEDRYTITAKIFYNNKGERQSAEFYKSVVKSNHRLTYKYVNDLLAGAENCDKKLKSLIDNANELTELLKFRRKKQGTIDFDLPEVEFVFDKNGYISEIHPEERGISERIIEHFMIEANEVVAEKLGNSAKYGIYRNHDKPDMLKLISWSKFAATFGVNAGKIPDNIRPKDVQHLFHSVVDVRAGYLLKSMLVRSMQRAEYSAENTGHFGLASECYTHFTSPIRRYPDLMVHRLLKQCCFGEKTNEYDENYLDLVAVHCSVMERNAEDAEREVTLYKKMAYLRANPDMLHDAYINKVSYSGIHVFLEKLLMMGFVDVSLLPQGRYYADVDDGLLVNKTSGQRYRLGDRLKVRWISTNIDTLEAEFACGYLRTAKLKQGSRNRRDC